MLTGCGGSGAHLANAAKLVEEELDQGEELATALPQKMEVPNVTRMDLWGKKVDLVMKRNAKQVSE